MPRPRVFVRLATLLALRKRQQRLRPDEVARLYQLEIIKLRMQIQEMAASITTWRMRVGYNVAEPMTTRFLRLASSS